MTRLRRRLTAALSRRPTAADWRDAALLLLLFAAVALPLGFSLGFLTLAPSVPWPTAARLLLVSLLFPALTEELLFRVLLLPHPQEAASPQTRWLSAAFGLLLFTVSHPLKPWPLTPGQRATFTDPVFLLLAALLGLASTLAYLRSGSLWPPTLLHWLAVAAWLLLLGGHPRFISP